MTEKEHLSEECKNYVETEDDRRTLDGGSVLLSTRGILQLLRRHDHTVTFFVVGEVNDWYPALIQEIREQGHEVAYHSHTHQLFTNADSLKKEIERSKGFIECFRPRGFRAPRTRITLECLAELSRQGFVYDSSSYGPFSMCQMIEGVLEIPISTYSLCENRQLILPRPLSFHLLSGFEIPFGSGYFISLLSLLSPSLIGRLIEKSNQRGHPSVLCLHPWQLLEKPVSSIHRKNLARLGLFPYDVSCYRAFEHLLKKYKFLPMSELIDDVQML